MNRAAVVLLASGVPLLGASPAFAATVTLGQPCYRADTSDRGDQYSLGKPRVAFTGSGFSPRAKVSVEIPTDSNAGITVRAGTAGTIAGKLWLRTGTQAPGPLKVIATQTNENDDSEVVATATALQVNFDLTIAVPRKLFDRQSKITVRGGGFYGTGKYLYAHVRGGGKPIRTLRMGKLRGPCGMVTARRRGPFIRRDNPGGSYRIQFDARRSFSTRTRPKFVAEATIARFPFGGFR